MTRRKRPAMTPMDALLGGRPAAAADPDHADREARYMDLLDTARWAMVQPDPLRGSTAAESVKVTTALLVRADEARP